MKLTDDIKNLMEQAEGLKKAVGVNKKALNKVIARLEEAWLWSKEVVLEGSLAASEPPVENRNEACICPVGTRDMACPVHGAK